MPSRSATTAALAVLVLIWGTTWAAIRVGLGGIPPFTGVALRFAIAAAVLFALFPVFGVRMRWERREVGLWLVNGGLSFCVTYGVVYWGEQYVPSALTSVLFATFPLWVALLAHVILPGERLTPVQGAGILVGFGGVAVIFSEDLGRLALESYVGAPGAGEGPGVAVAAAVILLSPMAAAVANVAVKRWGQGIHPLSLSAMPMALTAAVMGTVAALTESGRAVVFDAASLGALLYLALCGSAVTFSLYFWLLEHLPATKLSLITYATPVVAVAAGIVLLGEPFTPRLLAGAALVVAGVAVAVR